MKITVDIEQKLLEDAMMLTRSKTRKDVIRLSLEALVNQKRRERLKKRLGHFPLDLTLEELDKMRDDDEKQ
jgi:hypothetical protein